MILGLLRSLMSTTVIRVSCPRNSASATSLPGFSAPGSGSGAGSADGGVSGDVSVLGVEEALPDEALGGTLPDEEPPPITILLPHEACP